MKILLIDPPGRNKGLNTGLGYLSATLKDSHEIKVLDLNNIEMGVCGDPNPALPVHEMEKRIISTLHDFRPQLLGISVKTFTADTCKRIVSFVKTRMNDIVTVAGGPHITLDGLKFIQESCVDYGIQGEGEYTSLQLCNALEQGDSIENIEGLFYRKDDQLHHTPRNDLIKEIDAVPFPSYDNFTSVIDNGGTINEYPILTSRGCPYKCSYCSMPRIMGGRWRYRAAEGVIEELKRAKQKYHSSSFTVVDDNFTLNLKRVENICDLLISENINLPWNNQNGIRADRISEDMARKMKSAGCRYVWIGIESADENVFNAIEKGEKLEDIKTGIGHLKKAGIRVGGFFIIGLPHSTKVSDLKSVDFAKEQGIDGFWFNFVPYPHTRASEWVQAHGKALRSSDGALQFGSNGIDPVFETEEYTKDERINAYNDIHIKMKYFDRLVDPSLRQSEKWPKVFQLVASYGFGATMAFFIFLLQYNAAKIKRMVRGQ
ncbi:MAG: hypothetical protein AMK70_14080 [Nitrospira bacterium SG8_35_1]|nr:MAG: hypothetical protein AMK70_14080 [Nitrospira bacterium SG8_35_1]